MAAKIGFAAWSALAGLGLLHLGQIAGILGSIVPAGSY